MEKVGEAKEYNLKTMTYHGRFIIPPVRDQRNTATCFVHSSCTCVESLNKRLGALADPQKDFEIILSEKDFTDKFEELYGPIGQETDKELGTGFSRLLRCLKILQGTGVVGMQDEVVFGPFKIRWFKETRSVYRPKAIKSNPNPKASIPYNVQELFDRGFVLIGTFKISNNYLELKPGDIYTYDKKRSVKADGIHTCSHAVAMIGYGVRGSVWYYIFQNSHGEGWGENGIGRVNIDSITHLVHVKL